ncbi:MAG: hypothetical protein HY314_09850 [Acidobacteria bacterium]|nr:hypothetical protein [Acidobacteriota bacterium]
MSEENKSTVKSEELEPTGRRQFLKTTVTAAATGLVAGSGIVESAAAEPPAQREPCPPPPPERLRLVLGDDVEDLKQVRIPGLRKPFEELTISELVQLRPGERVQDTYEVNAVNDNISVTTSALLHELGKIRQVAEMRNEIIVNQIRSGFEPEKPG